MFDWFKNVGSFPPVIHCAPDFCKVSNEKSCTLHSRNPSFPAVIAFLSTDNALHMEQGCQIRILFIQQSHNMRNDKPASRIS